MKRMVERVGIGDTGYELSGTLQIAPLNADDVGVVILGSQKATQTGNYLEIRNSAGAALVCADVNGALYAPSFVGTMTIDVGETLGVVTLNAHAVSAVVLSGIKVEATAVTATTLCGTNVHASVLTADTIDMSDGTVKKIKTTTLTATTASGFTDVFTSRLTAARIDCVTSGTVMKIGTTTITGTTASGFTSIYGATLTATTICASTDLMTSRLTASTIDMTDDIGKIKTKTVTATTASGFTDVFTSRLTASTIDMTDDIGKIKTKTVTATTASGFTDVFTSRLTAARIDLVDAAPMKIGTTSLTATYVSGGSLIVYGASVSATNICASTDLFTSRLTADTIDMSDGTVKKIKTTTITATTISGATVIYGASVSATNVCASTDLFTSRLTADTIDMSDGTVKKIKTTTITATTASGFTDLFTSRLTASTIDMTDDIGKIKTKTITATTASGFTSLYATNVTATSFQTEDGAGVISMSGNIPSTYNLPIFSYAVTRSGITHTGRSVRVIGLTGTSDATITNAITLSCPPDHTMLIDASITAYCTAGGAVGSAMGWKLIGLASSGGSGVASDITECNLENSVWAVALAAGAKTLEVVNITVQGSANCDIVWGYDVTYVYA